MDRPKSALAVEDFEGGFNCSQSVLRAFAADFGLDRATASRIAAPFGGGLGRLGRTCGALTGGLVVIGLKHGWSEDCDPAIKDGVYERARTFIARFEDKNASSECRRLIGYDLSDPEEYREAKESRVFESRCRGYVADAVAILEEIL